MWKCFQEKAWQNNREFWIRRWACRKTGAKQVEQLPPSCPGTPVQSSGNLVPAQGGDCTWDVTHPLRPSGAAYMLGRDKEFCKPAGLPAASSCISPHSIVYPLKTIWILKLLNTMFLNVPLKRFSFNSCVLCSISKEWHTPKIRLCSVHKSSSEFPWTCLREPSPGSQLKVTSGTEHSGPGQPCAGPTTLPPPPDNLTFKFKWTQCSLFSPPSDVLWKAKEEWKSKADHNKNVKATLFRTTGGFVWWHNGEK